jgi:hypothetical protein
VFARGLFASVVVDWFAVVMRGGAVEVNFNT